MGSEASYEKMIALKWWEARAWKMLITTTIGKVEVICSLLPLENEKSIVKLLKAILNILGIIYIKFGKVSK